MITFILVTVAVLLFLNAESGMQLAIILILPIVLTVLASNAGWLSCH